MLKDKVFALVKTLHQRPRSRLVPLPDYAQAFVESVDFGGGSLMDALLKAVRDKTQLDVKRNDFKLEQLPPHLLMNFRIVDEHGRQLGTGRNLASLKAELACRHVRPSRRSLPCGRGFRRHRSRCRRGRARAGEDRAGGGEGTGFRFAGRQGRGAAYRLELRRAARADGSEARPQTLVGFSGAHRPWRSRRDRGVRRAGAGGAKHRAGLRRLVALQIKDALKYLEKNIPDLQKMAVFYMPLGTAEELRQQIIEVALDRHSSPSRCRPMRPRSPVASRRAAAG
jgi:ATP-dependent helicase HrpA